MPKTQMSERYIWRLCLLTQLCQLGYNMLDIHMYVYLQNKETGCTHIYSHVETLNGLVSAVVAQEISPAAWEKQRRRH